MSLKTIAAKRRIRNVTDLLETIEYVLGDLDGYSAEFAPERHLATLLEASQMPEGARAVLEETHYVSEWDLERGGAGVPYRATEAITATNRGIDGVEYRIRYDHRRVHAGYGSPVHREMEKPWLVTLPVMEKIRAVAEAFPGVTPDPNGQFDSPFNLLHVAFRRGNPRGAAKYRVMRARALVDRAFRSADL